MIFDYISHLPFFLLFQSDLDSIFIFHSSLLHKIIDVFPRFVCHENYMIFFNDGLILY